MIDNRTEKRRSFKYYMQVWDERSGKLVGHIADVSSKGFKIDCQESMPIGQDYRLRLYLTDEISNKSYMVFVARSKWCQADKYDPNQFNVGFQLISIGPADSRAFKRIVSLYGEADKESIW
jgi:hypothetical protein